MCRVRSRERMSAAVSRPVEPRHLHVHEDAGEVPLEECQQRLVPRVREHQLLLQRLQDGPQGDQVGVDVVHDQDAGTHRLVARGLHGRRRTQS